MYHAKHFFNLPSSSSRSWWDRRLSGWVYPPRWRIDLLGTYQGMECRVGRSCKKYTKCIAPGSIIWLIVIIFELSRKEMRLNVDYYLWRASLIFLNLPSDETRVCSRSIICFVCERCKKRLAKFNVNVQVTFSFKNTIGEGREQEGFSIRCGLTRKHRLLAWWFCPFETIQGNYTIATSCS